MIGSQPVRSTPVSTLVAALVSITTANAAERAKTVDFNREVRPILSANCFACHGPDEKQRKAKLRLDNAEDAFQVRKGRVAIKPGDPGKSEVWRRITTKDADDIMPPLDSHKKLKPEQIALLKRWMEQGASYKGHWAFDPPHRTEVPKVRNLKVKALNPIDSFIFAKLEAKGLTPSPEASKETLIRRVTLDLTGLPPTPKEVDEFLADSAADAYEKVVDRLLKSPRYGEHLARYWLDAARYGDTHGLHLDNERSMWPYRDWVVRAFNDNLPFDQFTIWQLAGDLLPNATRDQKIASGFNRCNVTTSEGGSITEEYIYRYAVDRTETAATVWMGLTAGCAVCHDHKFDPLTTKEFYSMYAFFNSAADPAMDGNILLTPPILKLPAPSEEKRLAELNDAVKASEKKLRAAATNLDYTDPATLDPPPPSHRNETIWVDDDFPIGVKAQRTEGTDPIKWVTAKDGKVFSGERALQRTAKDVAQDYFSGLKTPFEIPTKGKMFTYVYLDPTNLPEAVMLQFNVDGKWSNRAVWGDIEAIDFGKKDSPERMRIGDLPKAGEWARLEFDATKLGLKAGTKIGGLSFTQSGGTVAWDKVGALSEVNVAKDPLESFSVWEKENQGKANKDFPKEISDIFRGKQPKDRTLAQTEKLREYYFEHVYAGAPKVLDLLRSELKTAQTNRDEFDKNIPATLVMGDLEKPRESFVMIRGQYTKPGEKVFPNVPSFLPPLPQGEATNRLTFARWLVDPKHPLTARVAVNRFWQQFFGMGLVKTANDFGSQGEPPSHPELLDWLATDFMATGWDGKQFMRMIATSATYRQDSKIQPKHLQVDPDNRLLAHGPRFRLDGEVIRDQALFVSSLMDPTIGGKAVRTYQPENIWEPVAYSGSNTKTYVQDHGASLYRRSLYTFWKRTAPPPSMTTFDAPSREQFCVRRERSNTPLQALVLMNDVQHFEAARAFAQRMMTEGGSTVSQRLTFGFRFATGRQPTKSEQTILSDTLFKQMGRYRTHPDAAKQAISYGESIPKADLDPADLAAYTLVANMLLNLDEALTKN